MMQSKYVCFGEEFSRGHTNLYKVRQAFYL